MGYFASIARQSGLRMSRQHAPARQHLETSVEMPAPLEREDIVMVPPSVEERTAPSDAIGVQQARGESVPLHTSPDDAVSAPESAPPAMPATAPESTTAHDVRPAPRRAARPTIAPSNDPPHIIAARVPETTDVATSVSSARPAHERTVFVNQQDNPALPHAEPAAATAPAAVTATIEQTTPAHYFGRTAGLIAARQPDPVEMHTVILRDVQEWIADGPGSGRDMTAPAIDSSPEQPRVETEDAVPARAAEPGVARIGASRARPAAEPPAASTRLEEQHFELSIGSISVVLEGEDRPRPPSPAVSGRPIDRDSRKTPRRNSRLGRHYL